MWKSIFVFAAALLALPACLAAELTPTEMKWLSGAWPVIAFARSEQLPLDIVVQPQASPGAAPLALAFVDGRCKLVLSMRGNVEAPRPRSNALSRSFLTPRSNSWPRMSWAIAGVTSTAPGTDCPPDSTLPRRKN